MKSYNNSTMRFSPSSQTKFSRYQPSTAQRFYDLQQQQRKYHILLQQNSKLKDINPNSHNKTFHHSSQSFNQIDVWNVKQRNRFLSDKVTSLKKSYQKQSNLIHKIVQTQNWKQKYYCTNQSCYFKKYIQLLKAKRPYY